MILLQPPLKRSTEFGTPPHLDITERIPKYAKMRKDRVSAERAELPDGSHRFLVRIADTLQRVAEREISVTVQASGGN